jgi:putative endonuclease
MKVRYTYYVYILRCSDNTYYNGVTNDLERRFNEHSEGVNPDAYTHSRRPVELVYSQLFYDIRQAIFFEKRIKNWSKKKKEAIINDHWEKLPELSSCKNKTSHLHYKKKVVY